MRELTRREGRAQGQRALCDGVRGGKKLSSNGQLETKIALTASIPVHAAVASRVESQCRDVPGARSLGPEGTCRKAQGA